MPSWTLPTPATGNIIPASDIQDLADDLTLLTTWSSYTPTVTQSGAVTKTVTYAKYISANKLCTVVFKLAITGSGTSTNAITVSLPVTAATSGLVLPGNGFVIEHGVNNFPATPYLASTTTVAWSRSDQPPSGTFPVAIGVDPAFGLTIPKSVPGVPPEFLRARDAWSDKAAYDKSAADLIARFVKNFEKFDAPANIRAAAPGKK